MPSRRRSPARARTAGRGPQFDNGARCERAGAGIVIRPEALTTDALQGALERVLTESSFADAAARIAVEIEAMGTPAEVAEAVEEYASAG